MQPSSHANFHYISDALVRRFYPGAVTDREPATPQARSETIRQALRRTLADGAWTARELSTELGIAERDVVPHLEHLQRSLLRERQRLHVEPAECLACGFRFVRRKRLSRPGACPKCRSRRITPPAFAIGG